MSYVPFCQLCPRNWVTVGSDKSLPKGRVWGEHEVGKRRERGLLTQLAVRFAKLRHKTVLPRGDSAHVPTSLRKLPDAKQQAIPGHASSHPKVQI